MIHPIKQILMTTPLAMKKFRVITLFPDSIKPYLESSIIGRAMQNKLIDINYLQPRDFTNNPNHRIDQKPYGGGPGMVLEAEPFLRAWEVAMSELNNPKTIFFTPGGQQFQQSDAVELANSDWDLIFLCGRYEGIDQRVVNITNADIYSIGPYVITGGELPSAIMIDAIARQIPGVLGDQESIEENRISSHQVYTRPEHLEYQGKTYSVPPVLLSGNHAEIDNWRANNFPDNQTNNTL